MSSIRDRMIQNAMLAAEKASNCCDSFDVNMEDGEQSSLFMKTQGYFTLVDTFLSIAKESEPYVPIKTLNN